MRQRQESLTVTLWLALLTGILVGWSPLYWPFAVSIVALSAVAVVWSVMGAEVILVPEIIVAFLIAAWGPLQLAIGRSAVPALTLRASLTWLECGVAFLLGSTILRDRRQRNLFLRLLMWSLTLLALEALLQFYLSPQRVFGIFPGEVSVTGTLFYSNQFAALMEMGAATALWQVLKGRTVIGALCFAVMSGAVLATASRAGAALLAVELIAFLLIASMGKTRTGTVRSLVLLTVTFALAASAVVGTDALWARFHEKDLFSTRRELRASTLRMVAAAPVLGTGLGTWRAAYPRFATLDAAVIANEAHDDWVQWMADGGVPFFALMLLLAIRAGMASAPDVWGLGLIAVGVHCLVDYPMRSPAIAFLWFTLAGAACALRGARESARQNLPSEETFPVPATQV